MVPNDPMLSFFHCRYLKSLVFLASFKGEMFQYYQAFRNDAMCQEFLRVVVVDRFAVITPKISLCTTELLVLCCILETILTIFVPGNVSVKKIRAQLQCTQNERCLYSDCTGPIDCIRLYRLY